MTYSAGAEHRPRSFGKRVIAVLWGIHVILSRTSVRLSRIFRILPVLGMLGGRARYWLTYVSLVYFILFWIKQGAILLLP